ncbi:hypothetical protein ZYGR_0H00720 [Zygosaccharomyces rouxii]|uniref:ZYRO0B05632p n=2 Tax=Zygosaccharomyces rouxii TaxID=4956 RepID=C5DR53_ZYGRC|nr:uncharacterized protein ZYRO0B05632g [Zygosaccharomyces rouxii]KAH9200190.1 hypothetical protein LQ764DRAFT_113823 [Zygosaccharomyces rouxii]GAV47231.1 hypothetical protein ZYGR_0H00720 [Zygosaccharomyces rouxii]CAR26264.1 ZYRO0B05632p [Zygosaccharomyces rouxii]
MEDFPQSRVLEPIDSNSLSLISSSSGNGSGNVTNDSFNNMFTRPVTPTFLKSEGTVGGSFLGWQFDGKEFEFDSNSTPTKNNDSGHQKFLHVRKRHAQLMGAKPRIPSRLHQSISKLDLLDENSLTSLPIPPPISRDIPPRKRSKLNPVHEMRIHNDTFNRRISYGVSKRYAHEEEEGEEEEKEEEDAGHPIVMVEDYIPPSNDDQSKRFAKKKVSVSNLKNKMSRNLDMHVPLKLRKNADRCATAASSVTLVPHILDDNINDNNAVDSYHDEPNHIADNVKDILEGLIKPNPQQEHDKYLFHIAKDTKLRKCVICESLLYEVSSLLADRSDFKEIVCGKCTEKYEEAAKIFEEYEFESSCESSKNSSMSSMDSAVQLTDNSPQPLGNKANFSQELISRLQWQLQASMRDDDTHLDKSMDFSTMTWFIEAKKKIRWRWRVSGLLPHFLVRKYKNAN